MYFPICFSCISAFSFIRSLTLRPLEWVDDKSVHIFFILFYLDAVHVGLFFCFLVFIMMTWWLELYCYYDDDSDIFVMKMKWKKIKQRLGCLMIGNIDKSFYFFLYMIGYLPNNLIYSLFLFKNIFIVIEKSLYKSK